MLRLRAVRRATTRIRDLGFSVLLFVRFFPSREDFLHVFRVSSASGFGICHSESLLRGICFSGPKNPDAVSFTKCLKEFSRDLLTAHLQAIENRATPQRNWITIKHR